MSTLDQNCCPWRIHQEHHDRLVSMLSRMHSDDFAQLVAEVDIQNDREMLPFETVPMIDLADLAAAHCPHDVSPRSVILAGAISGMASRPSVPPAMKARVMA
jgi:hypothetical protein